MIAIARLCKNGNSTTVSIPTRALAWLGWASGQYVTLEIQADRSVLIRRAVREDICSAPAAAIDLPSSAEVQP